MKGRITTQTFLPRLQAACERERENCPVVDGLVFTGTNLNDLMEPQRAGLHAARHAMVFKLTRDERFRRYARDLLAYCGASVIEWKGISFFPQVQPNWSDDGRTLRRAFSASRWIEDGTALEWIADMIRRWPYKEDQHRFRERFMAGTNAESSRGGFAHTMNMLLEGGLDAWLVGHAIGDQKMMDRGTDVIENLILPSQREDNLWNYAAAREGFDPSRLGTEEYNYSQYVANMLAYLLEYDEWRDRLLPVVQSSFEELCRRFEMTGGAIWVPVHWGWGWVFETTLANADLAWKLYHHAGQKQYGELIARRLTWLQQVDVGPKYHQVLRDLDEMHNLWEIMADGLDVAGELPELQEALPVLERMEREISIVPGGPFHKWNYSNRLINNACMVLQRKMHSIRTELAGGESTELVAGAGTSGPELELPWRFGNAQLSTRVRASWTDENLSLQIKVANPEHYQPYWGSQMDMGDSVSLLFQPGAKGVRLTAALTRFGPQIFRYADDAEFSQQRGFTKDYHEGDRLEGSRLEVFIHSGLVEYELSIPWTSLGIKPKAGLETPVTIMSNKCSGISFQYMVWGKDERDQWTDQHKKLRLA